MSQTGEMHHRGESDQQSKRQVPHHCRGLLALVVGVALTACGASGGGDSSAPPSNGSVAPSLDTGPDFVQDEGTSVPSDESTTSAPSAPTTEFDLEAQPSTPAIEPIPETGVPGIDSSNVFCRAWSEFAGTFQALGLVSAVGDPANAFRLEVIAASSVTTAVETMEANLPADLEPERVALLGELAGPFFGRAFLAEVDLLSAGIEPDSLRDIWLTTLADVGVDDPTIAVDLPADVDAAALDAAVVSFSNAEFAIVDDPNLVTDAAIPATEDYLADVCPDGGILSGNDDTSS